MIVELGARVMPRVGRLPSLGEIMNTFWWKCVFAVTSVISLVFIFLSYRSWNRDDVIDVSIGPGPVHRRLYRKNNPGAFKLYFIALILLNVVFFLVSVTFLIFWPWKRVGR
jgi:heme O synthase-like polyprenyltransferase